MSRVKGLYPAPLHLLITSDAEMAVKIDGHGWFPLEQVKYSF